MRFSIQKFESRERLVEELASLWISRIQPRNPLLVAISGGRLAGILFREVVRQSCAGRVAWDAVELFWADERCVGADDDASNFKGAEESLIRPLRLAGERVHRIRGELEPMDGAALAEREFRDAASRLGRPVASFDLVILGMGEDGHVASLFPGDRGGGGDDGRLYLAVVGPKPPARRVTLSYTALRAAREVWVAVVGPGKSNALAAAVESGAGPLGNLLQGRHMTCLFVAD